jgi:S1-C subfamily serine protease
VVIHPGSNRPYKEIFVFRVGSVLTKYRAYVASFDSQSDLAILYLEGVDYVNDCDVRFSISSIDNLQGQRLQMVGFPNYRDGQSLFVGVAHAAAANAPMIEIDNSVVAGISGGPLLDSTFRVVGVLVKGIPQGGSKNEAISVRSIFDLRFDRQLISRLDPIGIPPSRDSSWWGKIWSGVRILATRIRRA